MNPKADRRGALAAALVLGCASACASSAAEPAFPPARGADPPLVVGAGLLGARDAARSALADARARFPPGPGREAAFGAIASRDWTSPSAAWLSAPDGTLVCAWSSTELHPKGIETAARRARLSDPASAAARFGALHERAHCLRPPPETDRDGLAASEARADADALAELRLESDESERPRLAAFALELFSWRLASWAAGDKLHPPAAGLLAAAAGLPLPGEAPFPVGADPAAFARAASESARTQTPPLLPADAAPETGWPQGAGARAAELIASGAGRLFSKTPSAAARRAARSEALRRARVERSAHESPEAAFELAEEILLADVPILLAEGRTRSASIEARRARRLLRRLGGTDGRRAGLESTFAAAVAASRPGAAALLDPDSIEPMLRAWCASGSDPAEKRLSLSGAPAIGAEPRDCADPERASLVGRAFLAVRTRAAKTPPGP